MSFNSDFRIHSMNNHSPTTPLSSNPRIQHSQHSNPSTLTSVGPTHSSFFTFFSEILKWIKKTFSFFSPTKDESVIQNPITTAQIQERICKGITWIHESIHDHFGNSSRNLN